MNLREIVNEVLASSESTSPTDLAAEVASQVPSRQVRAVFAEALVPYVRQAMQQHRNRPADHSEVETHSASVGGARSSKVSAIRSWSQRQLRERYHGVDGWKFLADFTYDDLVFAAEERRVHAEKNLAIAARFDALAELVQKRDVETVSQLSHDDIEAVAA